MDTVHVLLPVHNRREVTRGFVQCLKRQTYPEVRLILIDDGSTDGTQEVVRQEYPSAEFIQGDGTWWWAGCLQRGFDRLKQKAPRDTDIVLLANDDTTFDSDYIERAVEFLQGKQRCMLLSRIRNPATGMVEESGVSADLRTMSFQETKDPASINCLSTRGLFLRWDDMKIAGGFHPLLLPHYWSDYEYTIRAMRKGLKGVTTESVWLEANLTLSGNRDLSSFAGWRFVRELFSTKCLLNPIYKSSFVILACPSRWVVQNLLRIWWQALTQIFRQGLLRLVPDSAVAAGRSVRSRLRRINRTLQLKLQASTSRPIRIVLGAGEIAIPGWILTNVDQLNILVDRDWRRFFAPDSVDAILAEHVWEHLSAQEGIEAARLCFKYLRPGGRLRIAVPDGLHPDPKYVDAVKPGGTGPGAGDHKVLYSGRSLQDALGKAGFQTRPLEYFDEEGQFHATAWDPEDGMIHRSARFDDRNRNGELRYTSIIVDAVKPIA